MGSVDTTYERSVFEVGSEPPSRKKCGAEFVPEMRNKAVNFKIVDDALPPES